jgi:hypothetical protein
MRLDGPQWKKIVDLTSRMVGFASFTDREIAESRSDELRQLDDLGSIATCDETRATRKEPGGWQQRFPATPWA